LAQTYALQGNKQNGVTPCGYGFHFTSETNYEIFSNPPGAGNGNDCETRNGNASFRIFGGFSNNIESYSLKNGVSLTSPVDFADTEIYFTVPHANIFDRNGAVYPVGAPQFTFTFSGVSKFITVNSGGFVTESQ
jgi:hypothetical protein